MFLRCALFSTFLFSSIIFAQPVVTHVQDGAAYTSDIAQGSVFVVKGSGLSDTGYVEATAPNYPTILNRVLINITQTGPPPKIIQPRLIYTYNLNGVNQLSVLLPSTVEPGNYNLVVTSTVNGSTASSAPFPIRVVARKPGIVSADGTGTGPAQATTASNDLIRFAGPGQLGSFQIKPTYPGDTIVLWGTGFGPDVASDPPNGAGSGDMRSQATFKVIIKGIEVDALYAGRSYGYPGLDQLNFQIPANITPGCAVPVSIKVDEVYSNQVSIAIARPGEASCPTDLYSSEELLRLSLGQTVERGYFSINSSRVRSGLDPQGLNYNESVYGAFAQYTANQMAQEAMSLQPGQCRTWHRKGTAEEINFGILSQTTPLDAGTSLALTGPSIAPLSVGKLAGRVNEYYAALTPDQPVPKVTAGLYELSGTGGVDIGPFQASLQVPDFKWTNENDITFIDRNQGLLVTWTGNPSGSVGIQGLGLRTVSGNPQIDPRAIMEATFFDCIADGSAGSFTVPASILQELPVVSKSDPAFNTVYSGIGVVAFRKGNIFNFSAPQTNGGTIRGSFGYTHSIQSQLEIR